MCSHVNKTLQIIIGCSTAEHYAAVVCPIHGGKYTHWTAVRTPSDLNVVRSKKEKKVITCYEHHNRKPFLYYSSASLFLASYKYRWWRRSGCMFRHQRTEPATAICFEVHSSSMFALRILFAKNREKCQCCRQRVESPIARQQYVTALALWQISVC